MSKRMTIADIRKRLALSQAEFAKALGVSRGSISNWERQMHTPHPLLLRLAQSLLPRNHQKEVR